MSALALSYLAGRLAAAFRVLWASHDRREGVGFSQDDIEMEAGLLIPEPAEVDEAMDELMRAGFFFPEDAAGDEVLFVPGPAFFDSREVAA